MRAMQRGLSLLLMGCLALAVPLNAAGTQGGFTIAVDEGIVMYVPSAGVVPSSAQPAVPPADSGGALPRMDSSAFAPIAPVAPSSALLAPPLVVDSGALPAAPAPTASDAAVLQARVDLLREGRFPSAASHASASTAAASTATDDLRERLRAGLADMAVSIDVSAFAVAPAALQRVYQALVNEDLTLFYVGGTYTFTFQNGYVQSLAPTYSRSAQEAQSEERRVQAAIRAIVADCITDGMSDRQKALAINDYFCTHYEYAYDGGNGHNYVWLLLNGRGVCQAFSDAYTRVLRALGMTCCTVNSDAMRHSWNMLRLDDEWYHVDVTWNDRYNDADQVALGFARHKYFLVSDALMFSADYGHYQIDNAPAPASSTLYDRAFWKDVDAPVCMDAQTYYYPMALGGASWGVMRCTALDGADAQTVKTVDCAGSYGSVCMGLAVQRGRLYYNTATQIRSCLPDGSDDRLEAEPSLRTGSAVSRLYASGDTLYYGVGRERYLPDSVGTLRLAARQPLTALSLPESLEATLDGSGRLAAALQPENASTTALLWESSDVEVLSIDAQTGVYQAHAVGTAVVTASATDGSLLSDTCAVAVYAPLRAVAVRGPASVSLLAAGTQYSAVGTDAANGTRDVTHTGVWSTSDPAIATVEDGVVRAHKLGRVVIRCTRDGKTGQLTVNVVTPVTQIILSGPQTLISGRTARLSAAVAPADAAQKMLVWESDNAAATVLNGLVTAGQTETARTVVITARAADGFGASDTHQIRILPATASVSLWKDGAPVGQSAYDLACNTAATLCLRALAAPADAGQTFAWSTSAPSVAAVAVDSSGNATVTGLKNGMAVITAAAQDGSGKKATCKVIVYSQATEIRIANRSLLIAKDRGTLVMTAAVLPHGAQSRTVRWSVENGSGLARIDARGTLTAIRDGTVTVKAQTADGSDLQASAEVEIRNQTSYARLYGPKLSAAALTLNKRMPQGAALEIVPFGDAVIRTVALSDARFAIRPGEGTNEYRVTASDGALRTGRYAMTLRVMTEAESFTYPFTVTLTDRLPSVTLRAPSFNTFYPARAYPLTASSPQGRCTVLSIEDQPAMPGFTQSVIFSDGMLQMRPNVPQPVLRGVAVVQVEGYAAQRVPLVLRAAKTAVRALADPARVVVAKDAGTHSVTFAVYDSADRTRTALPITGVTLAAGRNGAAVNAGQVTAAAENGRVTVTLLEEYLASLTRNITFNVRLMATCADWAQPVPLSLTMQVQTTPPSVSYSPLSVTLNKNLIGETGEIALTASQINRPVADARIEPHPANADDAVSMTFASGKLITSLRRAPAGNSYRFTVTPQFADGAFARPAVLSVRLTGAAPTLALTGKGGALHALDRANGAMRYEVRLTNTRDTIASVALDEESAALFTCAYHEGILTLRMREGAPCRANARYSLTVRATLAQSGQTVQKTLTLRPLSYAPRLAFSPAAPAFYAGASAINNQRRIAVSPSFGEVRAMELVQNGRTPAGFSTVFDAARGVLTLSLDGAQPIKPGRYTLVFRTAFAGAPADLPYSEQRLGVTVLGR